MEHAVHSIDEVSRPIRRTTNEPRWARGLIIGISISFLMLFLFLPVVAVFREALADGVVAYFKSFRDPTALSAIKLTLLTAGISVPLNLVFGLAAAWCIAKFNFAGKSVLLAL